MSRNVRAPGRAAVLIFAAIWIGQTDGPDLGPTRATAAQEPGGVGPSGQPPGDVGDMPRTRRPRSTRKRGRLPEKKASQTAEPKADAGATAGDLRFSVDVAPILVANCGGCHSKEGIGVRRGKLDLSTFENLQKGTPDHKVIVPGQPEESHLVLRILGEETPKMPQGGNRALSAEAIATITRWVKEGARLDAGIDPKKPMDSYAATPEQLRRKNLARMSPKERDQKVIEAGQARWKQSGSKQKPQVVPGTHFILFSNLPADRSSATVKGLEAPYNHLKRLLGAPAMEWPEKVSLYVFIENNEFVEFVRSVENREVDGQEPRWSARLNVPQPYIATVDPAGGKKEEPLTRRRGRGKRSEEPEGPDRTLPGLLTEGLGNGSMAVAGNAPRWLREGIGAYLSATVEPRSPYYRRLRQAAFQAVQQGWQTRGAQAMGDQLPADELRAIGFALVECLIRQEDFSPGFPAFVRAMLDRGREGLDDVLKGVYNGTREEFLGATEIWIANAYGNVR